MTSLVPPWSQWKAVEEPCVMCNRAPARRCGLCRSIFYCSKECQRSDFSSHKLLCKPYAEQHSRPSPDHKRAIMFPADEDKPRIIWMKTERCIDSGYPYTIPDFSLLGESTVTASIKIQENSSRGRLLGRGFSYLETKRYGYCIVLNLRDNYLSDGSIPNRSFLASMLPSGMPSRQHRGPIIAYRMVPIEAIEDITLADFRHIIDHSLLYRMPPPEPSDTPFRLPPPFALAPPPAPAPIQESNEEVPSLCL